MASLSHFFSKVFLLNHSEVRKQVSGEFLKVYILQLIKEPQLSLMSVFITRVVAMMTRFLAIHSTTFNKYLLNQESTRSQLRPKARL